MKNPNQTVIILGCSWACGEWGSFEKITHQGLAQYFQDSGYNCVNLSQPGGDLYGLLWPLESFIRVNTHFNISRIVFVQTDLGRSFHHLNLEPTLMTNAGSLQDFVSECYKDFYSKLNQIACRYHCKIDLVGGLTDITVDLTNFSNLNVIVPSWCRIIEKKLPLTALVDSQGIDYLQAHCGQRKQELLQLLDLALARRDFFAQNPEFFWPDGIHPNRHAHHLLYQVLEKC